MKSLPDGFDERLVVSELARHWDFEADTVEYADVGFGSYHWVATGSGGSRVFVTVDDLDNKPWLGDTRESAFTGLRAAFDTAFALREAGLEFVVAPLPTFSGGTVERAGARHSIAVFPFVEGESGSFGEDVPRDAIFAELHGATTVVAGVARDVGLELIGRSVIEADDPWAAGPFSAPAQRLLAHHEADITRLLADFDGLSTRVAAKGAKRFVTHGEPHGGNVIRTRDSQVLVDWDTVAMAPAERDLWMLSAAEIERYVEATGHAVDVDALELFRLAWDLNDLAAYIGTFRLPHRETEDTEAQYEQFSRLLQSLERQGG